MNKTNSDTLKVDILNKLAGQYKYTKTDSGVYYIKKSIAIARANNMGVKLAAAYSLYGIILKNMGHFPLALEEQQRALNLYESQKDTIGIASTYNNIGLVHVFQENQTLALKYLFSALKLAEKTDNKHLYYRTLNNIGYTYQRQNRYIEAIGYFKKVLELDSTNNNLELLAHSYINLGRSYLKTGRINEAIYFQNKSLKANIKIKSELGKTFSFLALSDLYFELAQKTSSSKIKKVKLKKAIHYANQALKTGLLNGYTNLIKDASYKLYLANKEIGDKQNSLKFLELYVAYKDSIYDSKKMKELESLEAKFQSEKKALRIDNLEKESLLNEKNLKILRNRQIFLGLLSVSFLFLIVILLSTKNKLKKKNTTINKQNSTINEQYIEITQQNLALEKYKNHLEEMIKEQTADLIVAKEKAEYADKLKTAFLENLSHEIRTPLNAIVGFSNLIEYEEGLSDEGKKFVAHINDGSNSLLKIIDSIMQVSNMQLGQLKLNLSTFNLQELLDGLFNEFIVNEVYTSKKQLKLKTGTILETPIINSDADYIRTILYNLIDNAIKFTEKGTVEFGCHLIPYNKDVKMTYLQFYVKDTGIGITEENIKFIFDKFRKVDIKKTKLYPGLGLGLTIVKNMVEQLGGNMWVESQIDKGSTFYFTIVYTSNNKLNS